MQPSLNHLQRYLAQEFVDDYHEGRLSRRDLIRRVLGITGGVATTATVLLSMGCEPTATPAPAAQSPGPTARPTGPASPTSAATAAVVVATAAPTARPGGTPAAGPAPTPGQARSPLSVPPDDPDVTPSDVTYPGDGATLMGYLAQPKGAGPRPGVLVCHENRGLTDHIRDVARRFAKAGYVALAPDLLARDGGTAKVDPSQVPGKLTANPAQNVADLQAAIRHLQGLPSVSRDRIGMVGFCFGGGMTWLVATANPDLKAAVPFYGPNPPLQDVPRIKAAVLGIYGGEDQRIDAGIPAIEEAMKQNGKVFEKIVYPGAGHAFFNDTGANYNEQAALDAWQKTLDWLKKYVG